ncbi:hypothetical protein [Leucobacter sp. gxy201]|uniref:hypothetical protein n=1 Tax=Leucobacter sp. gxy201 TaxID=2957200 RepID=UPI003DA1539B
MATRMDPRKARRRLWFAAVFFGLFTIVGFATTLRTGELVGVGFTTMGLGLVLCCAAALFTRQPESPEDRAVSAGAEAPAPAARPRFTTRGWVMLVIAAVCFMIGPFVMLASGYDWLRIVGAGHRRAPFWVFAVLMWAGGIALGWYAVKNLLAGSRR